MIDRYTFRGRKKNSGDWFVGDLCQRDGIYISPPDGLDSYDNYEVDPATVGQCTDFVDVNDHLIFEGDIVTYEKQKYQICFECGGFALYDRDGEMISKIGGNSDYCYPLMVLHSDCDWYFPYADNLEIIGNAHDNPELAGGAL